MEEKEADREEPYDGEEPDVDTDDSAGDSDEEPSADDPAVE